MPLTDRSKATYQPWNQEEFVSDRRVRRMSSLARKTYATLLHEMFFCSTRPYLPDDPSELELLADCDTLAEWESLAPSILPMFEKFEKDGVPLLRHGRVEADWFRLVEKREERSRTAKESAIKRWQKENPTKP